MKLIGLVLLSAVLMPLFMAVAIITLLYEFAIGVSSAFVGAFNTSGEIHNNGDET